MGNETRDGIWIRGLATRNLKCFAEVEDDDEGDAHGWTLDAPLHSPTFFFHRICMQCNG